MSWMGEWKEWICTYVPIYLGSCLSSSDVEKLEFLLIQQTLSLTSESIKPFLVLFQNFFL